MNTELILLIISLFSNAVIILKKIRVIWTPCLIISCVNSEGVREANEVEEETNRDNETPNRLKQFLNKLTPRKQQQTARVATLGSEPRQTN